jgi:methylenetetrahydrofolate dehydrogenase (NADP+) / methenyltetrahydrofolate cyclohydrolase
MTAQIIDGKAVAARVRAKVAEGAAALAAAGVSPGLAVVLVGDDPASAMYVRNKSKAAKECGIAVFDHKLGEGTPEAELLALLRRLNDDPQVDGILVQLPVPKTIDTKKVLAAISPWKDVDGLTAENAGLLLQGTPRFVPCTPKGCMALLAEAGAELRGARALVVGRSLLVGKPVAQLLLAADATVTQAHSRTRDLAGEVARADVLVAAVGKGHMIKGDWIRDGAVVLDVGTNHDAAGKLIGDVEFETARQRARAITPVPGGVGPTTIAMLLDNTVASARLRAERPGASR